MRLRRGLPAWLSVAAGIVRPYAWMRAVSSSPAVAVWIGRSSGSVAQVCVALWESFQRVFVFVCDAQMCAAGVGQGRRARIRAARTALAWVSDADFGAQMCAECEGQPPGTGGHVPKSSARMRAGPGRHHLDMSTVRPRWAEEAVLGCGPQPRRGSVWRGADAAVAATRWAQFAAGGMRCPPRTSGTHGPRHTKPERSR